MPMGLTNAPATFQRHMDIILSGLLPSIKALVYIDDIIILKRTSSSPTPGVGFSAGSLSFWAAINKNEGDISGLRLLERQRVKVWLKNAFTEIAKQGV